MRTDRIFAYCEDGRQEEFFADCEEGRTKRQFTAKDIKNAAEESMGDDLRSRQLGDVVGN